MKLTELKHRDENKQPNIECSDPLYFHPDNHPFAVKQNTEEIQRCSSFEVKRKLAQPLRYPPLGRILKKETISHLSEDETSISSDQSSLVFDVDEIENLSCIDKLILDLDDTDSECDFNSICSSDTEYHEDILSPQAQTIFLRKASLNHSYIDRQSSLNSRDILVS